MGPILRHLQDPASAVTLVGARSLSVFGEEVHFRL